MNEKQRAHLVALAISVNALQSISGNLCLERMLCKSCRGQLGKLCTNPQLSPEMLDLNGHPPVEPMLNDDQYQLMLHLDRNFRVREGIRDHNLKMGVPFEDIGPDRCNCNWDEHKRILAGDNLRAVLMFKNNTVLSGAKDASKKALKHAVEMQELHRLVGPIK